MIAYQIQALPEAIADAARTTQSSPQYGHPAHAELAKGYGPCRSCLRRFRTGEENRLLFTYNPFDGLDPYPAPGPIFIHEDRCDRYQDNVFPPELRELPLMFEGYGAARELVTMERGTGDDIDQVISRILSISDVHYIHVHNAEAGCFIAQITRMG
jgi:hypothetical protein